uniref:Uncharacterized protein n=1 Tax=Populus trichocarpa TaxID=3694 RepID=A0A3N7GVE7_POPTR
MGNIHRAFLILFSLIVIHVLMSSLLCLHHERKVQLLDRNQGRRLLVPFASLSANVNKSTGANRDPRKAAETSLRKAPPSFSNPTQNKDACFKFYGNKAYEKELHLLTFQIIIRLLEFSPPLKEDLYSLVRSPKCSVCVPMYADA